MAYDMQVAFIAWQVANARRVSRKVMLALFEAGIVESGMRNLDYGDRDSLGFLQQRASWGSVAQRMDVAYATRSFLNRAITLEDRYSSSGRLAQGVQVSAFPDRYQQQLDEASALIERVSMAEFSPRVTFMTDVINAQFPKAGDAGTYPGHGEDGSQYAADFWTTDKAVHDQILSFVISNAKDLGVKYIISWVRIWSLARASEGIRHYSRYDGQNANDSELHKNHVHISFDPRSESMAIIVKISDAQIDQIAREAAQQVLNLDGHIKNAYPDAATNPYIPAKHALYNVDRDVAAIKKKLGA